METYRCRKHILEHDMDYLMSIVCSTPGARVAFVDLVGEDISVFEDALDSPQVAQAIIEQTDMTLVDPKMYFYVGVRHILRKNGFDSRDLADYLAYICTHFLYAVMWDKTCPLLRPEDYTAKMIHAIHAAEDNGDGATHLTLNVHVANYCLFLTGILGKVVSRKESSGGRPMDYYIALGKRRFTEASEYECPLEPIYATLASDFDGIRQVLCDLGVSAFVSD